jgi:hypothetical protein
MQPDNKALRSRGGDDALGIGELGVEVNVATYRAIGGNRSNRGTATCSCRSPEPERHRLSSALHPAGW